MKIATAGDALHAILENKQFNRRMQVHLVLILGDIKSKGTSVKMVNKFYIQPPQIFNFITISNM